MSNESQINLNVDLITQKFHSGDYTFCIELLKEKLKLRRNGYNEVKPVPPTDQTLFTLGYILSNLSSKIKINEYGYTDILLIKQCFESLRNSAACGEKIQNLIINNSSIIQNSYNIFKSLIQKEDATNNTCLRMQLQFLCNLIVSNKTAQLCIWNTFSDLILISMKNMEVCHVSALIIYNIFKENPNLIPKDKEFTSLIIDLQQKSVDNISLLIELLINQSVITNMYPSLNSDTRINFLLTVHLMIISENNNLNPELFCFLSDQFKNKSDSILKTVSSYLHNIEPIEVAKLLDCLSLASSNETYLSKLQEDKSLVINCVFLLKSIHEAGKSEENNFSPIQKLSEVNGVSDLLQEHPGFGFKASLIQLLGNLCWKHKENQNLMRELDCIPVLLDCCNIDARNPLIIQWVILAIRNLCENNKQNQAVIAETTKVRVVDSALLHEMGITLNDGNGHIKFETRQLLVGVGDNQIIADSHEELTCFKFDVT